MRHLFYALLLASAAAIPTAAHADAIDDFVLTGDGHTFRFSLPAVTPQYVNRSGVSGWFTPLIREATVDGVGGYTGSTLFHYIASTSGGDFLSFANPTLGSSFGYDFYTRPLIYYTDGNDPNIFNLVNVFFDLGSYDLYTRDAYPDFAPSRHFTLTITPEASTSVTPEPATLTLLATGALGLLTSLRRRLIA